MKARRRLLIFSICLLLFIAAVASVVLLRKRAAPEPARLLPEADAVLYVDFGTVRNLTAFDQQQLPKLAPGYDEFVTDTGFSFERDLDEAAMAIHRGATPRATRYTEILVGHYDQIKLAQYLRQHSASVTNYRGVDIFTLPIEDRTLRIALLAIDTVAISNVDDPALVQGIIDRFKKVALPFGGPRLVRSFYRRIPLGSLLWAISHVPAAPASAHPHPSPALTLPGGVDVGLPGDSDVVVSLRMLTTIHARAEFYTRDPASAKAFADQTSAFLALFRSLGDNSQPNPADGDIKAVLDSIKVTQRNERAIIQATIPPSFLRKLVNEPAKNVMDTVPTVPAPQPAAPPAKAAPKATPKATAKH